MAAREGGGDPEGNPRLKAAIQRAKEANIPNENINRAIQRGVGNLEGANYEELYYEGYGPGGVAVLVHALTDNRNRTSADVRHLFSKYDGNLGEAGCVAWQFQSKGVIIIDRQATDVAEDDLLLLALEAGAEDVEALDDAYELTTAVEDLHAVADGLRSQGIPVAEAEITMVPQATVAVTEEVGQSVLRLVDALEDYDDVQDVYTNLEEA